LGLTARASCIELKLDLDICLILYLLEDNHEVERTTNPPTMAASILIPQSNRRAMTDLNRLGTANIGSITADGAMLGCDAHTGLID
jgi:hypothetical protein